MGKQQKKITRRKSQPKDQQERTPTTDDLARDLVRRGLASRSILELRHAPTREA